MGIFRTAPCARKAEAQPKRWWQQQRPSTALLSTDRRLRPMQRATGGKSSKKFPAALRSICKRTKRACLGPFQLPADIPNDAGEIARPLACFDEFAIDFRRVRTKWRFGAGRLSRVLGELEIFQHHRCGETCLIVAVGG